jgi:hypothetical protein
MRLIPAPKLTEEINEKLLKSWDQKSGQKYLWKSQKWKILYHKIWDNLTQTHNYIDANQEFTMCENHHNILPLFGGLEGSLTLSSPLLHHEAHPHRSKSTYS